MVHEVLIGGTITGGLVSLSRSRGRKERCSPAAQEFFTTFASGRAAVSSRLGLL